MEQSTILIISPWISNLVAINFVILLFSFLFTWHYYNEKERFPEASNSLQKRKYLKKFKILKKITIISVTLAVLSLIYFGIN